MIDGKQILDTNVEEILKELQKQIKHNDTQVEEMPTPSADELGRIVQYVGESDEIYTRGYFYECFKDLVASVEFEELITCDNDDFLAFLKEQCMSDFTQATGGTMKYIEDAALWDFTLTNASGEVETFRLYQVDFEDAGFVFTGTAEDGQEVAFTCSFANVFGWRQINVQPTSTPR